MVSENYTSQTCLAQNVLVTDSIFGSRSKSLKKKGFMSDYEVISYSTQTKKFKLLYKHRMIEECVMQIYY